MEWEKYLLFSFPRRDSFTPPLGRGWGRRRPGVFWGMAGVGPLPCRSRWMSAPDWRLPASRCHSFPGCLSVLLPARRVLRWLRIAAYLFSLSPSPPQTFFVPRDLFVLSSKIVIYFFHFLKFVYESGLYWQKKKFQLASEKNI